MTVEQFDQRWTVEPKSGCHLWTGGKQSKGYGMLSLGKRRSYELAHRYIWRLLHGEIPAGMQVLHRCDTRLCVNPAHLFLGTPLDNMRDMMAKGRSKKGKYLVAICKRGHPYDETNTWIDRNGGRHCRKCALVRYHKNKPPRVLVQRRRCIGERNPNAKFTTGQILDIRASQESNAALGKRYGVSYARIWLIRKRKSWKHLT